MPITILRGACARASARRASSRLAPATTIATHTPAASSFVNLFVMEGFLLWLSRILPSRAGEPPRAKVLAEAVDRGRDDDRRADDDLTVLLVEVQLEDPVLDHADHQRAEQRPQGRAAPAGQARPADDRRRDHVQLVAGAGVGGDRREPAE